MTTFARSTRTDQPAASRGTGRFGFVALVLVSVVGLVVGVAGPAGADTGVSAADTTPWRIVSSPNRGAIDNHLQEVSCVNDTRCVSVGYNQNPTTGFRLSVVETLISGTWKLGTIPQRGTGSNTLWNVSCVTGLRCVAVGYYADLAAGFYRTLIATYANGTWTLNNSPNRSGTDNYLFGVDCTSASSCVAVGRSYVASTGSFRTLILTLSGGVWTIANTPNRASVSNLLADVSCGDATHCVAVGYTAATVNNATVFQTLVLAGDGNTWSVRSSKNVPAASNQLRDVSCATATECVAVGGTDPGSTDEQTLIENLSGGVWSITTSPSRPSFDNHLWAVSCPTSTSCVAAGQSQNSTIARTLILTLTGGVWALTPSTYRGSTFNFLYGLSCPNLAHCVASGDYINTGSNLFRTAILTNSP